MKKTNGVPDSKKKHRISGETGSRSDIRHIHRRKATETDDMEAKRGRERGGDCWNS